MGVKCIWWEHRDSNSSYYVPNVE